MTLAAPRGAHASRTRTAPNPLVRLGVAGLAAIWAAVFLISVFAPDNVSGSEQEHVPLAAILTWVWGLLASRSLATTLVAHRARPDRFADLRLLTGAIAALWLVAAAVAVFGPVLVTGSDPTRFPIAALLAPIAAMVVTTSACQLFTTLSDGRHVPRH